MHAETDEASASASWMDIRFDNTFLPFDERPPVSSSNGRVYLEAEDGHPALDRHLQRSRTAARHAKAENGRAVPA